jgi:hypothetical protein
MKTTITIEIDKDISESEIRLILADALVAFRAMRNNGSEEYVRKAYPAETYGERFVMQKIERNRVRCEDAETLRCAALTTLKVVRDAGKEG